MGCVDLYRPLPLKVVKLKKVDLLVLRAFAGPFLVTFFIVLLFFVLQFFYVYIDDFVGKGLEWYVVLELIVYLSANVVPIALPLAILLSSIMTFGAMGERYELTALKSSGISLARFMGSTVVATLLLSIGSLAFSNYVMPSANLKFYTTLFDITQSKPALDIEPNQFYTDIDDYVIKIDRKGEDGQRIYGVYVANQSSRRANDDIMVADSGIMFTTRDNTLLVFRLYNGKKYEVMRPDNRSGQTHRQTVTEFKVMEKVFDLAQFKMTRTDEDRYRNHYIMMNMRQLNYFIDSMRQEKAALAQNVRDVLDPYFFFYRDSTRQMTVDTPMGLSPQDTLGFLSQNNLASTFSRAIAFAKSIKDRLATPIVLRQNAYERYIVRAQIEWHRKYMLAVSCLVLLFVGAPFGAIVRKGGFGYPVIFAIIFYVIYYILFKVGEDIARNGVVSPFIGMWAATFIMTPVALFFTYKAMNDSSILLLENYAIAYNKVRLWIKKRLG